MKKTKKMYWLFSLIPSIAIAPLAISCMQPNDNNKTSEEKETTDQNNKKSYPNNESDNNTNPSSSINTGNDNDNSINFNDKVSGILDSSQLSSIFDILSFKYTEAGEADKFAAKKAFENLITEYYNGIKTEADKSSQFTTITENQEFNKYFVFSNWRTQFFGHPVYYTLRLEGQTPMIYADVRCPDRITNGVMASEGTKKILVESDE
ncbi:hypothetical protein [Metamycoplasma neophronis]|uniref:Variable surface lipoprotein n=1 Tax=Metamycoplasma neophronis TaxID=872983 RepID=A0ABY2Z404_9BACT|nr:hypothetical protein [Metamycoplasma neophronis]TPR53389.1 hypothetical protein FJR74_02655 [Metamycoplasma neophronis]